MQFTKLRLVGFKSFVESQEFVIERGLTGVVGPNGCGKSNLVEALRWVMGENSYKNMRASGMDDVIFSGSNIRPARNSAEVTLFLNNSDFTAPPAFNDTEELQVSRRIERESGSNYTINSKDVRAKDVQLLFADQSTGARSPSMVGQGRVGELIQAKPEARRALLEEAAGISGLHSRRHEAELRLKAAETNLGRLEDVVGDLSSRIESLKRQARQANRFKGLSTNIREIEAGLYYLKWAEAKSVEAEAETHLTTSTSKVAENAQAHMRAERARDNGRDQLPPLRDEAAQAAAAHQYVRISLQQLEADARRLDERRSELTRRLEQIQGDIARETQLAQENTAFLTRLDEEEEELIAFIEEAAIEEETRQAQLETVNELLELSENALSVETENRATIMAEVHQLKQLHVEAKTRANRVQEQFATLERDLSALISSISALGNMDDIQARLKQAEAVFVSAQESAQLAENNLNAARQKEQDMRAPVLEAGRLLNELQTEARTLEKILHNPNKDYASILNELEVDHGYETALGAVLGDDLDVTMDDNAPLFWRDLGSFENDPKLPDSIACLKDHVRAPELLSRRLKQVGIVSPIEGESLQKSLHVGQVLVSLEGAVWRWDGMTAQANAPTAAAQRLAQKNRMQELIALIENAQSKLDDVESQLRGCEAARERAENADKTARLLVEDERRKQETMRDELNAYERKASELISRKNALEERRDDVLQEQEEAAIHVISVEEKILNAPDVSALEQTITKLQADMLEKRSAVMQARGALDSFTREKETRLQRLGRIANERENWKTRVDNARRQVLVLEERQSQLMEEAEDLAASPDEFEEKRNALLAESVKAEERHKNIADQLAEADQRQANLDKALIEAFAALSSSREERARAEERVHAAMDRCKELENRILDAFNSQPHEIIKIAGFDLEKPLPNIADLEHQLEILRIERERLGAVNLRAEEEEQELRTRYQNVTMDRDDIIEAIKKLRQAIHGLNREGRERLLVAFEKVNAEFQRLFTHLFGGGTAELQLIESDDPLDAGLEILARPPGKKPQTMTLLSGGEQALTALALIFAVFLTNPAPICVLDEVDAPLDDSNVERYCNLLEEMARSTSTRFIVITHNPITMSRMNRLFGVTMAEQGVSQLVSVDLQTAEQMRDSD